MPSLPGLTAVALADALVVAAAVGHATGLAPFVVLALPAYVTAAIGLSLFEAGTPDAAAARQAQAAGAGNLLGFIVLLLLVLAATAGSGPHAGGPGFHLLTVGLVSLGALLWNARLVAALGRPRRAVALAAVHLALLAGAVLWAGLLSSPAPRTVLLAAPLLVAAAGVPWALGLLRVPAGPPTGFSTTPLLGPA